MHRFKSARHYAGMPNATTRDELKFAIHQQLSAALTPRRLPQSD